MAATTREIHDGWTFTQVRGGQATKEGEWLPVQSFPTTVHVELLGHKKIPDPVSLFARQPEGCARLNACSSSGCMNGTYNVGLTG